MNEEQSFKARCIGELFGHVTLAGYVSEQVIGGASFIRLDVPEVDGQAAFTKLLGAGAIYSITPTDEDVARSAIGHHPRPAVPEAHGPAAFTKLLAGAAHCSMARTEEDVARADIEHIHGPGANVLD